MTIPGSSDSQRQAQSGSISMRRRWFDQRRGSNTQQMAFQAMEAAESARECV